MTSLKLHVKDKALVILLIPSDTCWISVNVTLPKPHEDLVQDLSVHLQIQAVENYHL
jgi:hypothetical protein